MKLQASICLCLGLGASTPGLADTAKVSKIHFDYNAYFVNDDHKELKSTAIPNPTATTTIGGLLFLGLKGDYKKAHFDVYFNTADPVSFRDGLRVARGWIDLLPNFTVAAGYNYVNLGGFDQKSPEWLDLISSPYGTFGYTPFGSVAPMLEASYNLAAGGNIAIQLLDDVARTEEETAGPTAESYRADRFYFQDAQKQPAAILEWIGTYGGISPLVQFALYDGIQKSQAFTLGVKANIAGMDSYIDFVQDQRKLERSPGTTENWIMTSINVKVAYDLGMISPFVKFVSYNMKQDFNRLDFKGNTGRTRDYHGHEILVINDNASLYSVGARLTMWEEYFTPYLAINGKSLKVLKTENPEGANESRANMQIQVGMQGTI
jgi:hypothetical protein